MTAYMCITTWVRILILVFNSMMYINIINDIAEY